MAVKVTFMYDPEQPDDSDKTGLSEEEYVELTDAIMQIGGYDFEVTKVA